MQKLTFVALVNRIFCFKVKIIKAFISISQKFLNKLSCCLNKNWILLTLQINDNIANENGRGSCNSTLSDTIIQFCFQLEKRTFKKNKSYRKWKDELATAKIIRKKVSRIKDKKENGKHMKSIKNIKLKIESINLLKKRAAVVANKHPITDFKNAKRKDCSALKSLVY